MATSDYGRPNEMEYRNSWQPGITSTSVMIAAGSSAAEERVTRVGLAVKEGIVKKSCKDSITIEYISTRLLKARISITSSLVTFVVG